MEHAFNTNIAAEYDVNIAVLLHNFKFWTFNNLANKRNIHDGFCWTYNTLDAFCLTFPYFSKKQIRTTLDNAVKEGLIIKGNYNQTKYDRTVWYALSHKAYWYYPELASESFIDLLFHSLDPRNPICPFGQMEKSDWANRFPQKGTPIPDTISDIKTKDISTSAEVSDLDDSKVEVKEDKKPKAESAASELKAIQADNIFSIPEQAILDWIANRKKKRVPVTPTAWKKINKELGKCKEHGLDPIEAFETFVANGWQSFKIEWFLKDQGSSQNEGKNSGQSNVKNYW